MLNQMGIKELRALGKEHHIKEWWSKNKTVLIEELSEILKPKPKLIQTAPPEKIVALIDEKEFEKLRKPNLHIKELTYAGKTQTIREWANELKMPWATLYDRINRNGWTVEEALCTPLGERRKRK
jgi:hypothetical protein